MPVQEHRASDYLRTPQGIAEFLNAAMEHFEGDFRLLMKASLNGVAVHGAESETTDPAESNVGLSQGLRETGTQGQGAAQLPRLPLPPQ